MTSDQPSNLSTSPSDESPSTEPLPPPAGSRLTIDRFPDGVTIQLLPAGISGTKGLFLLAILWNTFMAIFSPMLIVPLVAGQQKQEGSAVALSLFLSIFWLVGIGLLLAALNMARRRAAFAVTAGNLMVLQTGLFGSKQRDFEPGDVEAVRVGESGMTVNDKPVLELHILDGGAHKMGLLAGRPDAELHWLAAELSRALKLPAPA